MGMAKCIYYFVIAMVLTCKKHSFCLSFRDYLLSIRGLGLKSVECVRLLTLHHMAFPVCCSFPNFLSSILCFFNSGAFICICWLCRWTQTLVGYVWGLDGCHFNPYPSLFSCTCWSCKYLQSQWLAWLRYTQMTGVWSSAVEGIQCWRTYRNTSGLDYASLMNGHCEFWKPS